MMVGARAVANGTVAERIFDTAEECLAFPAEVGAQTA